MAHTAVSRLLLRPLQPLSVVFGWSIVEEFLAGAHDLDTHFVETNPRHNLPVLLALTDVWNDTFLSATARAVTPFTEALAAFPAYVGALESQTCCHGRQTDSDLFGTNRKACSSAVLDGGLDRALDRTFFQSDKIANSELVMTLDCQVAFNVVRTLSSSDDIHAAQDTLMCSLFAHADELAFGRILSRDSSFSPSQSDPLTSPLASPQNLSTGNRPSTLLICGKLDAFACGQLIALSEHRAVVKAHIWGIDPFVRDVGSSLCTDRTEDLRCELANFFSEQDREDGDDEGEQNMILSTKTLLSHYANLMRGERPSSNQN